MKEVLRTIDLKIGYKGTSLMPPIDVALHEGEAVALVGANGSGKTTLFKTLTGSLKPIAGQVMLCGKPLSDYTPNERAKLFSLVLTEKPDDLFLKVFDIVAAGRYPHSGLMAKLRDEDYSMIKEKLQVVGVYHLIDRDFVSLSDGEKQKVMIAKALVQDTPIIYMDEPSAFLDYPSKVELLKLISRLAKDEHKTILYSSHDLELLMKHAETMWLIAKGKPMMVGRPGEVNVEEYMGMRNEERLERPKQTAQSTPWANSSLVLRAVLFILITMTSCTRKTPADLIVHNAKIYTVDADFSMAQAFAVKDGKFIAVGDEDDILGHYEATETIDAEGRPVYPGFMDGHCHFSGYAENLVRWADLKGCQSFDEVIERLKVHDSLHPSEWLLGRGWDQNLWIPAEFPDNQRLAEVFPGRKVLLTRVDGHAVLVSKEVLDLAGITPTFQQEGGLALVKDGRCTGILLDNIADMAKALIPPMTREEKIDALLTAQEKCWEVGLRSVTDAGSDIETITLIDSLQEAGLLRIHVNAMVNPDDETMDYFLSQGIINKDKLTVRSVKIYADGALGSRGAKLLEPYSDAPETSGMILESDEFYRHVCQKAYDAGYQVCCHAIGDGGVHHILDIYSEFLKGPNDLRWRIEHSQVVDNDDFQRYHDYSIIPSIQTTHCTSDMDWAGERLGPERIKNAYAYQRLLQQNGWVINGTDFPIEDINPLYTFYAATERKHLNYDHPEDGILLEPTSEGFQMENSLTLEQALRSITIWVAKGCFLEHRKGSIEIGKDADYVILDNDFMIENGK